MRFPTFWWEDNAGRSAARLARSVRDAEVVGSNPTAPTIKSVSSMDAYIRAHITVSGVVQGVGYRFFAQRVATQLGITGYVRNLPDGRVEVVAEGKQGAMNAFIEELRRGPWSARVSGFNLETSEYKGEFNRFMIRF